MEVLLNCMVEPLKENMNDWLVFPLLFLEFDQNS